MVGVLVHVHCHGRAAWTIADRMRRAVCRGGSVSFTGRVDIELVKRWKCMVYHVETDGCGFLRGALQTPILQRMPSKTSPWSDMGIWKVS